MAKDSTGAPTAQERLLLRSTVEQIARDVVRQAGSRDQAIEIVRAFLDSPEQREIALVKRYLRPPDTLDSLIIAEVRRMTQATVESNDRARKLWARGKKGGK